MLSRLAIVPVFSFRGDFRLTRELLEGSARGWVGALVFFTIIGGIECPLELMDESGLILWELPDLWGWTTETLAGNMLCPLVTLGASDVTDPEFDAKLRRRLDWLVGLV